MVGSQQVSSNLDAVYQNRAKRAKASSEKKVVFDKIVKGGFLFLTLICSSVVIIVTIFILIKGLLPFRKTYSENGQTGKASLSYFLTGLRFNNGFNDESQKFLYGTFFLVFNTIFLNILVALIAIPMSVLTALFIARIAPKWLATIRQNIIDLLAAIPSVIYGIFGLGVIVPLIKRAVNGFSWGVAITGISMLAGALVLSLRILPTILSISVNARKTVDKNQINGSLALGASPTQTNFKVVLRNAKSGIFAGIILGIGRSLGEATAVSMVCGSPRYGLTINPLNPTITLSSQMLLSFGEAVPGSMNYDIRFSAGVILRILIIVSNCILNDVKNHVSSINKSPLLIQRPFIFLRNKLRSYKNESRD